VLCVVDHLTAVILEKLHRLADQLQVLLFADAERTLGVEVPGLAEN